MFCCRYNSYNIVYHVVDRHCVDFIITTMSVEFINYYAAAFQIAVIVSSSNLPKNLFLEMETIK